MTCLHQHAPLGRDALHVLDSGADLIDERSVARHRPNTLGLVSASSCLDVRPTHRYARSAGATPRARRYGVGGHDGAPWVCGLCGAAAARGA
jgi:hypothetical protein